MSAWVNFKHLRGQLDFAKVLDHYGANLELKGQQLAGFCPLPSHNGRRNSPSFSANLERRIFHCFGCGAKGNILDFAVLMEKLDPEDGDDVRKVALELQKRFGLNTRVPHPQTSPPPKTPAPSPKPSSVVVNEPLACKLAVEADYTYLSGRGFTLEIIQRFGLGCCSKGYFHGRVVIPLHDQAGKLVGYSGRVVDDAKVSADNPKYLFPGKRTINGVAHEFHKGEFVYNGHRIAGPVDDLIVVEGFASVWWLTQHGFENAVAIMGSAVITEQVNQMLSLVNPNGRIWLFLDGDTAGRRCSGILQMHLGQKRFTRSVDLPEGMQPTRCSREELHQYFGAIARS